MFYRSAIDFLENEFSQRNPQVKTVTSKGTELDTIAFRSEDPSGRKVKWLHSPYCLSLPILVRIQLVPSSDIVKKNSE